MDGDLDEEVRLAARATAPDRYLSALLAPRERQADLIALAAFLGDIDRIIATVREPALAEIRLAWWREAIAGGVEGSRTGHPLADTLNGVIRARSLDRAAFDALIDARTGDLYADPVASGAALDAYFDATDGAVCRLAACCLGATDGSGAFAQSAGRVLGRVRLLRTVALFIGRGRPPFPAVAIGDASALTTVMAAQIGRVRDDYEAILAQWRSAPYEERAACLPLALVRPYLAAIERPGHDAARMVADIQPLNRVVRLWLALAFGWV